MPRYVLTNVVRDHWVESLDIRPADLGLAQPGTSPWSIAKRTLRGGRREGVETVVVDNGSLSVTLLPTRGMNLWVAHHGNDRIGWRSPVVDGPVHPSFVELAARGGLGWLQGFDELMARCGLESNGPPVFDDKGRLTHTLHGRIAAIPANLVTAHVEDTPPHTITIEAHVDESELFFAQLRLATRFTTIPGTNRFTIRDEIVNRHNAPSSFALLYHWNFGPPQLEEAARFLAPVKTVCPRDAVAAEGIGHYDVYGPPQPGFREQVYLFTLHGDEQGKTVVALHNRAADKGIALRFDVRQLPCFTLWKSSQGLREGYVTGLEPGVNYPNPRPFEEARGRMPSLPPDGTYVAETTCEALDGRESVASVVAEIRALQAHGAPVVHAHPVEPFAPAG